MSVLIAILTLVLAVVSVHAEPFAARFLVSLEGDEGTVHPVALAGRSLLVGIGSEYGYARVLDADTGAERVVLTCPTFPSDDPTCPSSCGNAVAASPRMLAVGAADRVHLFDLGGRYRRSLNAGIRARHSLAARGNRVLVGSYDAVHLFAARSGRAIRAFDDPDPAAQLSFGAAVALVGRTVVVGAPGTGSPLVPGTAGRVYGFDLRTGALLWMRGNPDDPAGETHAGRYFGWQVAQVGRDALVGPAAYRLHARTGEVVQVYADPDGGPSGPSWFGGALAASGNRVAIGDAAFGPRGAVHVYEADSGALVETIEPDDSFLGDGAGRFVALHRRYAATTSSSYSGAPRLLGFVR